MRSRYRSWWDRGSGETEADTEPETALSSGVRGCSMGREPTNDDSIQQTRGGDADGPVGAWPVCPLRLWWLLATALWWFEASRTSELEPGPLAADT